MLRRNILANYAGQAVVGVLSIAFIPQYVQLLGIKAYGLVGVFAILQTVMAVFDLGMTPALNREMARYSAGAIDGQLLRDLLRSLESIYAAFSLLVLGGFWLLVPWLSGDWFAQSGIPAATVTNALNLMAVVVVLRAWELIYRGAIQGMQRQVWLNVAQSGLAALRWMGALGVLIWVSPTIEAFFIWQGLVSLLTLLLLAFKTYRHLPATARSGHFSLPALQSIWKFTSSLALVMLVTLFITQADKVMLTKWLPLEVFGYYTLAAALSNLLPLIVYPMNNAVYPRLSEQVADGNEKDAAATYLKASQWLNVLQVPPAIMLALFAEAALLVWTGDPVLSAQAAPILRLLVIGNMFNGFVTLPLVLQYSHGWTRLNLTIFVGAIFLYLPPLFFALQAWGALGAAGGWMVFNFGYVCTSVLVMHRRLLPDMRWPWIRDAILSPLLPVLVVGGLSAWLLPAGLEKIATAAWLGASGLLALLAAAWGAPATRGFIRQRWR